MKFSHLNRAKAYIVRIITLTCFGCASLHAETVTWDFEAIQRGLITMQVGRVPDKVSGWNESYYTEAGDEYTKNNMVSKDDLLASNRFRNMRWEGGEVVERSKPYERENYVNPKNSN